MKKFKGICLALLTVVLSVAMFMGTLTLSAFAAIDNVTVDSESNAATFVKRVEYNVPTKAFHGAKKVVKPSGISLTQDELDGTTYTPVEIGVYTVYYNHYSYTVYCYLDGDYELRVENNGADIATYMEEGNELTIPKASVWFKGDDDDDYEEWNLKEGVDQIKVYVSIPTLGYGVEQKVEANETKTLSVAEGQVGTHTVHYYATVGDKGTKYLYKDYTVKVQQEKTVNDTVKPQLTVVNVPTTLSLNTKVNLPKATATDNYDENVKVVVTVQVYEDGDWHDVREPEGIDLKTGYAFGGEKKGDENKVVFDNEYNLSFYPTVSGATYKITYVAIDDADNKTAPETHTYTATCSDRTSPVLQEIDADKIPTTWGLDVVRAATKDDSTTEKTVKLQGDDLKIKFPYPTYVDNSDSDLTVSFEIKDTTNNKTVLRFSNIYDKSEDGEGRKYTYNADKASDGIYNPDAKATGTVEEPTVLEFVAPTVDDDGNVTAEGGFVEFDFNTYEKSLQDVDKSATATGSYTVTYQARDNTPNIVTKTYDITVESTFTDTDAPSVENLTWQEGYLVFTDSPEDFTIPTPDISDNKDSNLKISYKLYDGATDTTGIEVKGGETAKLQLIGGKPTITVKGAKGEKDQVFTLNNATTLEYQITATDDAGNETVVGNRGSDKTDTTEISIVNADNSDFNTAPTITPTIIENKILTVGTKTPVGGYTVEFTNESKIENIRKYYGFEISLYTISEEEAAKEKPEAVAWTSGNVELYTWYNPAEKKLYVKNITFSMPNVAKVIMYFRVYDVAGRSYTDEVEFTAKENEDDDDEVGYSALNIGTSGTVQTSYILKNTQARVPSGYNKYIVRKIQGTGKFSLMGGTLFTAYNAGTFTFTEYFEEKDNPGKYLKVDASGSYDWTVSEKSTPVWQVQGKMPTYTALGTKENPEKVTLPHVVASTEYANAKITLDVTFTQAGGSAKSLTVAKDESENESKDVKIDEDGKYYFEAEQDGTYTVKYTATYGDNETIEQTFTIRAGDIVAPLFSVDTAHKATATENSRFKFSKISVSGETISDLRFTKTLEGPDGTTVFSVDGTGETYRNMETQSGSDYTNGYKFTKTGVYTVRYKVTDKAGNESMTTYTITVSAAKVNNPVSTKIISTILIIVGVLLIAGVILYFVRFRKVKTEKAKK